MNALFNLMRYVLFLPLAIFVGFSANYILIEISKFLLEGMQITWDFLLQREINYRFIGNFIRHIPWYIFCLGSAFIAGLSYGYTGIYIAPKSNKVVVTMLIIATVIGSCTSIYTVASSFDWDVFHAHFGNILGLFVYLGSSIIGTMVAKEKKDHSEKNDDLPI